MKYGNAIVYYRQLRGWSQKELAEKADVSPSNLSVWENNKQNPHPFRWKKISEVLGVPLHFMNWKALDTEGWSLRMKQIALELDEEIEKQLKSPKCE